MTPRRPSIVLYHNQRAVSTLPPPYLSLLTSRIPFKRFTLMKRIHTWLVLHMLRMIENKLPDYETVWCMNPWHYAIQNDLRWKFLIFDCDDPMLYTDHWFYKSAFSKKLVYLYVRNARRAHPAIYSFRKDPHGVYKSAIWKVIQHHTKRSDVS